MMVAVSVKLTGSIVTCNGLAYWAEGAGENNPHILEAIETRFMTITSSLVAIHRHLRIRR
jgi:hypothetical protein